MSIFKRKVKPSSILNLSTEDVKLPKIICEGCGNILHVVESGSNYVKVAKCEICERDDNDAGYAEAEESLESREYAVKETEKVIKKLLKELSEKNKEV